MMITCQNPSSSRVYTNLFKEDTHHQNDRALLSDCVQEYLRHGLTRQRCHSLVVILNREKQTQEKEPAEDRRDTDGRDNSDRSRHGRVVSLFSHVCARIET